MAVAVEVGDRDGRRTCGVRCGGREPPGSGGVPGGGDIARWQARVEVGIEWSPAASRCEKPAYQKRPRLSGDAYHPLLRKTDAPMPGRSRATVKNHPRRCNHRQHNLLLESAGLM